MGLASDPVTFAYKQVMWIGGAISVRSECCGAGLGVPRALNKKREAAGYADEGYEDGHWYWNSERAAHPPARPAGRDRPWIGLRHQRRRPDRRLQRGHPVCADTP